MSNETFRKSADHRLAIAKNLYYITANTLIAVVMIVVGSHLFIKWQESRSMDNFTQNFSQPRRHAYAHMSDEQIKDLLDSTWNLPDGEWVYDEWVGFKEAPRQTRYVNVNEYGIRQNSSSPLAMADLNGSIWFFGGSTTFGYGVADSETIPARLESILKTRVVNFGRGYFYSAQENQLFKEYLQAGYRPKRAIFLDGVNERCDIDVYQTEMKTLFEEASAYSWDLGDVIYPVEVLSEKYTAKLGFGADGAADSSPDDLHALSCSSYGKTIPLTRVLQQNLEERKSLCSQYSLDCATFVQPFAGVHGIHADLTSYPESDREVIRNKFLALESTWTGEGAISVTDALDQLHKHAYVDDCHYSAEASGLIAREIADKLANSPI